MLQHTALSEAGIQSEIDRYIYIPGQACCYLYGFKKFMHLREKAQAELGKLFDSRSVQVFDRNVIDMKRV